MRYGDIKIIGEQVFFDNVAIADIREDAQHGLKEDFKRKILMSNRIQSEAEDVENEYDGGYSEGFKMGKMEGYSEAIIDNSHNDN